mmetsp:Transcript_104049/g.301005  ORF Transcript_104049/g.301005 Transcript_104049/m.301005 type:complete len:487 (+) Transcript_104049:356-1816(+)
MARGPHSQGLQGDASQPHEVSGGLPWQARPPQSHTAARRQPEDPAGLPRMDLRPPCDVAEELEGVEDRGDVPRHRAAQVVPHPDRCRAPDPGTLPVLRRQEAGAAHAPLRLTLAEELAPFPRPDYGEAVDLRESRGDASQALAGVAAEARRWGGEPLPKELVAPSRLRALRRDETRQGRGGQADEHNARRALQQRGELAQLRPPMVAAPSQRDAGCSAVHQGPVAAGDRSDALDRQVGERGDRPKADPMPHCRRLGVQPDRQGARLGVALALVGHAPFVGPCAPGGLPRDREVGLLRGCPSGGEALQNERVLPEGGSPSGQGVARASRRSLVDLVQRLGSCAVAERHADQLVQREFALLDLEVPSNAPAPCVSDGRDARDHATGARHAQLVDGRPPQVSRRRRERWRAAHGGRRLRARPQVASGLAKATWHRRGSRCAGRHPYERLKDGEGHHLAEEEKEAQGQQGDKRRKARSARADEGRQWREG